MKTLCMDSAHRHLILGLLEDGNVVASCAKECWKRQSETLFPELISLCEQVAWKPEDIDEVIITDGPGSYTGVRIAMAIAKVFCTTMNKPLSCISTLQLYAGTASNAFVMLDARSQRAYCALYDQGHLIGEEAILTLDEIKEKVDTQSWHLVGDCALIQKESEPVDFLQNFAQLLPLARPIEHIHLLTPRYLKDADAYRVKK